MKKMKDYLTKKYVPFPGSAIKYLPVLFVAMA
jgi:hypothetical protein